jgi:DNA (cytosine-5)-methyltransferase 1
LVDDGVREARDARTDLWRAFVEVAVALNPRAILMENVPDMALGDDFQAVRTIVAKLEKAGYAVDVRLVDAWRYGVPQHRKRLLVLARHDGGSFSWPPEEGRITTLADAIGDLPELGDSTGGRLLTYHEPGKAGAFVQRMRRGAVEGVVHDHMTRPVRADDREVFMQMTTKTKYSDIPEHLRRYTTNTFNDKYKRLAWTDLSRSITAHIAKDGYWYIHPGEARTLTVREAARIQTFPDTFRFAGTRSDAFRQIGNAVPPLLAEAAARALLPHGESQPTAVSPQWSTAQSRLTKWARAEQRSRNWHALPGPAMTTAVAAAAALLSGVRGDTDHVADALAHLKGRAKFNTAQLREAAKMLRTASARRRMGRLEILCRRPTIWSDPQRIKAIVGMSAAEAALFDVLNGGDAMLLSTGAFRVAAAVSGSKSLERNRLTDGRVDVARLIGHGKQAPLRMAALRLIGETICTTTPRCGACPLRSVCAASATCLPDLPPPEPARLPR